MIDIPRDIWLRVAQFIPDNSLKELLTVNAAFFDMAMNARYQDVFFYDLGNEKRMRWYARLKYVVPLLQYVFSGTVLNRNYTGIQLSRNAFGMFKYG
jgi:hypothetical protein